MNVLDTLPDIRVAVMRNRQSLIVYTLHISLWQLKDFIQIKNNSENNKLTPPKISKRLQNCFLFTLLKQNFILFGFVHITNNCGMLSFFKNSLLLLRSVISNRKQNGLRNYFFRKIVNQMKEKFIIYIYIYIYIYLSGAVLILQTCYT
jgi:hypothetical protein